MSSADILISHERKSSLTLRYNDIPTLEFNGVRSSFSA